MAILGLLPHPDPQDRLSLGPRPWGSEGAAGCGHRWGECTQDGGEDGHRAGQQRDRSAENLFPSAAPLMQGRLEKEVRGERNSDKNALFIGKFCPVFPKHKSPGCKQTLGRWMMTAAARLPLI